MMQQQTHQDYQILLQQQLLRQLFLSRYESGAWNDPLLIDDGGHGNDGDTGKNLTLFWDASQEALLVAYYDFWDNGGTPAGRIRMATITESATSTEDVAPVKMPLDEGSSAHYYHSLGLTLVNGTATIASFSRTKHPGQGDPTSVNEVYYLSRQGIGSWDSELVTEGVTEYLYYSAPLELLPSGPQGYPLLIYFTGEDSPDSIVIWKTTIL